MSTKLIDLKKLEKGSGIDFINEIHGAPLNLDIEHIKQFYATVIELFKRKDVPEASMNRLMVALCKTVSSQQYIGSFVENKFIIDLPYNLTFLHEHLLNFLYIIVSYSPRAMTEDVCAKFVRLIKYNPRKCLTIIAIYAQNFEAIVDPWPLIDLLFKEARFFKAVDCAEDYVSLIVYLCQHFEDYRDSRLQHSWNAICDILTSENTPTLVTCYYSLCQLHDLSTTDNELTTSFKFPSAAVSIHLMKPAVIRSCLSLLFRIQPTHKAAGVVQSLLAAASTDVNANLILVKMATKKNIAKLLIHDATWMTKDLPSKVDTMRLFAVVMSHVDLRPEILKKSEVIDFFRNISTIDSSGVLTAICTFIRRLDIDRQYIELLSKNEFLSQFFATAVIHTDDTTMHATLLMIDTIAKIGYVRDLVQTCDYVTAVIKNEGEIAPTACKVAVELCKFPKCAQKFQRKKLDDYFLRRQKDPKMKKVAVHFLKAFGKSISEPIIDSAPSTPKQTKAPESNTEEQQKQQKDEKQDSSSSDSDKLTPPSTPKVPAGSLQSPSAESPDSIPSPLNNPKKSSKSKE